MRGRDLIKASMKLEKISRTSSSKEREAFLRRAVSGLYYGTLWELVDFLKIKPTTYNVHAIVRNKLKAMGKRETSRYLKQLHDLRKIADYEPHTDFTYSHYTLALSLVNLILKGVGR